MSLKTQRKETNEKMDKDYCVVCGAPIPEGTLVCPTCEKQVTHKNLYEPINEHLCFIKSYEYESRENSENKKSARVKI